MYPEKKLVQISVTQEITAVAYIVEIVNLIPNFHMERIKIGMFIIRNHIPVPMGTTLLRTIARPVSPPGAILLGSISSAVVAPYMIDPIVISIYSAILLNLFDLILFIT
jgi:hypothetical protein